MSIRNGRLLYHLTSIDNIEGIIRHGLIPRAELNNFDDVADREIIGHRQLHQLDSKVPFHFFAKNPFDGNVQANNAEKAFVLIAVHRALAQKKNWQIIPRHPLAQPFEIYEFDQGMEVIDWNTMDRRDYSDQNCKNICMAECLAPATVEPRYFASIYTKTPEQRQLVSSLAEQYRLNIHVNLNQQMFSAGQRT
ncbi:DarT ssDNA thymidine ADP-ribosyltransferase family protein [Idiomarina sp.]|uniref:DarT ssDNA thymidine ADP-ribosyltransferase family protein n=1 Tax=Idiomarina sp. TaxID=1874361 RepID=UPI00258E67A4|nr:DarT ssDNA thymidine ADP-ribosyltransferase family protein [Idiomarina sp.]